MSPDIPRRPQRNIADILSELREHLRDEFGREWVSFRAKAADGLKFDAPFPSPSTRSKQADESPQHEIPSTPIPQPKPCRHSPDFRSIRWFGTTYTFTESQAEVVRLLWEAYHDQAPDVGDKALLRAAGTEAVRLADVFRECSAWGELIIEGSTRGTHRLADPGTD